jgi:hypothetical protein
MIHLPLGDNALCAPPYTVYTAVCNKSLTSTYQYKISKWQVTNYLQTITKTLVCKHFVPFGKSGDMGDSITTKIIHRHNAMLKSTKQRVLTNLNDIDAIIEMETPETATIMARLLSGKPSCPTRTTPEHRFSAPLRLPKLEAHIASYSMTTNVHLLA